MCRLQDVWCAWIQPFPAITDSSELEMRVTRLLVEASTNFNGFAYNKLFSLYSDFNELAESHFGTFDF